MPLTKLEPSEIPDMVEKEMPCGSVIRGLSYDASTANYEARCLILVHFGHCGVCQEAARVPSEKRSELYPVETP